MTLQEFYDELTMICRTCKASWPPGIGLPYYIYDNPSFHKLDDEMKFNLKYTHAIDDVDQVIQHPPPYSGDIMQLVEHAHAIVAAKWFAQRLLTGAELNIERNLAELRAIAMACLTPEVISRNAVKLQMLLEHIVRTNTGDYAKSSLV